ncbi:uncharacterized protein LOC113299881 [Papaver somniferum]|uniref:uncharacterized protein LOC113299881 n=1 Tax=Papaver somniferum TaxID=3469 RepID=UPI000E701E61|nr:uncharacterized protein LOC113299881 [Papaver somniferum]
MAETTFGRRDPASFPLPGVEITHSVARPREKKPSRVPDIMKTPDELEASFIQLFKDYTKAAAAARSEEKNDCEKKLIKVIKYFRNLKILYSTVRHLFPRVLDLKEAVPLMINLLKDDKCGKRLASSILWTFEELTHVAYEVPSQKEQVAKLVKSLFEMEALQVFVSTLGKFSEDDDLRAVQTIAQMCFHGGSAVVTTAGSNSKLMNWVFEATTGTKWDVKVCAVGFLHTLLFCSYKNRLVLGTGTLPVVIDALSALTSPGEEKTEEQERKEEEEDLPCTFFDCLFFLLEHLDNKIHFFNSGGVEAMIKVLQDGQELGDYIYGSAIAVLDIVKDCASDKFENEDLGLDIAIFPASMDMIHGSTMHVKEEIEERLISLIESLTGGISKTKKYTLLKKFEENDCERITWLMELFTRYSKNVEAVANHPKSKQVAHIYYSK